MKSCLRLRARWNSDLLVERHDERMPNRWIDNTYRAIASLDAASMSQREGFRLWAPIDRRAQLLENERR